MEAAFGDRDGEGVLGVGAAGFDALVAEHALVVVAHTKNVVDLDRLHHNDDNSTNTKTEVSFLTRLSV